MPPLQSTQLAAGLGNLRKFPTCMAHVYLNLNLPDSELSDVTLLESCSHLQNVNLSGNELTDVKTLGKLLHLTRLDVSKNHLTQFLDFNPPRALREVDYSDNGIEDLGSIGRHPYLRRVVCSTLTCPYRPMLTCMCPCCLCPPTPPPPHPPHSWSCIMHNCQLLRCLPRLALTPHPLSGFVRELSADTPRHRQM
jgi:hypothetical protein